MSVRKTTVALLGILLLTCALQPVQAIPVVDAGAIAQLVAQIEYWKQQIQGMTDQLAQLKTTHDSMTGPRGMERLLVGTSRNYLPAEWQQLDQALRGLSGTYGELARGVRTLTDRNAVLTVAQLNALSPEVRTIIEEDRRAMALRQVTSRDALANVSSRFQAIQQLINTIPNANDPKAVFDLQARIQAELGMLQNEQTKLQMLEQVAQADEAARRQREWEVAVAGQGRFATRFQPQPR